MKNFIKNFLDRRRSEKNKKRAEAWEASHTPSPGTMPAVSPPVPTTEPPQQHGLATGTYKLVSKTLDSATESKKEARSAVQRLMDKLSK